MGERIYIERRIEKKDVNREKIYIDRKQIRKIYVYIVETNQKKKHMNNGDK